jgi:hypothetical protein
VFEKHIGAFLGVGLGSRGDDIRVVRARCLNTIFLPRRGGTINTNIEIYLDAWIPVWTDGIPQKMRVAAQIMVERAVNVPLYETELTM